HAGDELPLAREGSSLAEVIAVISAKGYGCAFMIDGDGKLAGIITDGDLRRHPGLPLGTPAQGIMTKRPRTISPEALLADALDIMQTAKINVLIIVEDERPIGLVHLLDLLRKGVA
ncbi:MAG: CBS domain-containing protein, partial [Hyphomicrobiales bacterium]|nr:CBS domain-containing protein [Hyphomicrobiales bacterium]